MSPLNTKPTIQSSQYKKNTRKGSGDLFSQDFSGFLTASSLLSYWCWCDYRNAQQLKKENCK